MRRTNVHLAAAALAAAVTVAELTGIALLAEPAVVVLPPVVITPSAPTDATDPASEGALTAAPVLPPT